MSLYKIELVFLDDCSHLKAYKFYTEAVQNGDGFVSTQCPNYGFYIINICRNSPTVTMGGNLTLEDSGIYYLTTNSEEPYSK